MEVVRVIGEEGLDEITREAEIEAEAVDELEREAAARGEHEKAEEAVGGLRAGG